MTASSGIALSSGVTQRDLTGKGFLYNPAGESTPRRNCFLHFSLLERLNNSDSLGGAFYYSSPRGT